MRRARTRARPTLTFPRFIKKIATGNLRGSAQTILDANILGASCARVCPVDVLCEGACVMHRYNRQPIEIGRLQRRAMDHFYAHGAVLPVPPVREGAGRVACIGAGPASLACAAELRKHGIAVTVFEKRSLTGGLNTYGVAEYKLRASDSLREVELVRSLGVEFRTGVEVGVDVPIAELEAQFDAIFVGAGLGNMHALGIPGEDLPGVVDALRFIADYKTARTIPVGRHVAVIGAGNTAIDAACAAKRLGAENVFILYRRGEAEMSAFRVEYEHALSEGVVFHWHVQPSAILPGGDARVAFIECSPAFRLPVDMVIPAIGQAHVPGFLDPAKVTVTDRATGRTADPRYFAGGDCVNGGREVVDAVADGKRAAHGIADFLQARHG